MILDQFKLDGRVAIVTGSAQGLGQGIALGLAEAGADVALVDILDMSETREQIESLGRRCVAITADLMETACIPAIIDTGMSLSPDESDVRCSRSAASFQRPARARPFAFRMASPASKLSSK